MHVPARTCIGCRAVCAPAELVRLVAPDGVVQVAAPGAPGRGAWVHPRLACIAAAVKARAFARAFRRQVSPPEPAALLAATQPGTQGRGRS